MTQWVIINSIHPRFSSLLDGFAWEALCLEILVALNLFTWTQVIPDLVLGVKKARAMRLNGSHEKI